MLFTSVSHLKDDELAQKWVEQYHKTGHEFVSTLKEGMPPFQDWMNRQVGRAVADDTSEPAVDQGRS